MRARVCSRDMPDERLRDLYERLYATYGPQGWWPSDGRFAMIAGGILTQRTSWRNAEQALHGLETAGLLSIEAMHAATVERIIESIRPAGFYRSKAQVLKGFVAHIVTRYRGALEGLFAQEPGVLRQELLSLRGVGPETADAILVYAAGVPTFVIDGYARRLLSRLGWMDGGEPYEQLRHAFLDVLPKDVELLGEYHALIVRHGKERCRAVPICAGCPLEPDCAWARQGGAR